MANEKLLEIKNLTVHYQSYDATVHAVENLNLSLGNGETLGLVGETGAGKTTTVKSIMRILPTPPARVVSGEIFFDGQDLLKISEKEMRKIRGKEIAMIFQDPMTSLNPVMTVADQIAEVIRLHDGGSRAEAHRKTGADNRCRAPALCQQAPACRTLSCAPRHGCRRHAGV